jgi:glycosyltransferase involved in cell wall biosynthesis
LPTDQGDQRLHRTGVLARSLRSQGHKVTWWTSTFDHYHKAQRWDRDHTAVVDEDYRLHIVHSPGYTKNVSIRRVLDHSVHARRVKRRMLEEAAHPDVILCSLPTLELCQVAVDYGHTYDVPVILDIRDLWPDIFLDEVPAWAHWVARPALLPMFRTAAYVCSRATALTGITSAFVDWGLAYGRRSRSDLDKDFPLGYSDHPIPLSAMAEARQYWRSIGLDKLVGLRVCFFGNLSRTMAEEMLTVIEAARQLQVHGDNIQFVICGRGENLEAYRKAAQGCDNIVFPGWVDTPQIRALMEMSSVGLLPYRSRADFARSIPNKVAEYLSAGLPVISSLKGITEDLLKDNDCGVTYQNGDASSLVLLLRVLASDKDRMKRMARNAFSLFSERFDAARVYHDMGTYLQEVASMKRRVVAR